MLRLGEPDAGLPCDGPAGGADDHDADDAERVLDPLVAALLDVHDGGERAGTASAAGGRVAAVASWEADVAGVATAEEGRLDAVGAAGGRLARALRVLHVVVDALRNEDEVGKAEVDCEGDDGRDEASPEGAGEVGDIANEPHGQEGERDAVCRAGLVVLNQLRHLGVLVWVVWSCRVLWS